MKANRILQIGNPESPLNRGMGLASQSEENQIYWYSPIMGDLPSVHHYALPKWIAKNYLFRAILEPFFVAFYIWKIKPDLVQVHYASKGLATIPIIMHKLLVVSTMGSDIAKGVGYKFPYRFWIDLMLSRAAKVTTRSQFMKNRLIEMGVEQEKIEVNSWGIDLDHFSRRVKVKKLRKKWGLAADAFVFFDPRSASPLYNKDIIIKAFAETSKKSKKKLTLLVAAVFATEEELRLLKKLIADLEIENKVTFLNKVDYKDMPELYSLSEVTVSVPSSDGMPQTIFEAWACGSFLIVGDLPQYDEFIEDGVTAKRVPIRDVGALSKAMLWIIKHPEVQGAAIELGRAKARNVADRKEESKKLQKLVIDMLQ